MKHYRFRLEGKGTYFTEMRTPEFTGDLYYSFGKLRALLEQLEFKESAHYIVNNPDTWDVVQVCPEIGIFKHTIKMGRDFKTSNEDCRVALDYSTELYKLEEDGAMCIVRGEYELRGEIWTENDKRLDQINSALLGSFLRYASIERIPADTSMLRPRVIQSTTIPQEKINPPNVA